ncbi:hypothetical protein THIOSC15_380006 [uncultured Thiomicrorhabdus sp.]
MHWHQTAKDACEPFGEEIYPKYKEWCDDYFYLKHRDELVVLVVCSLMI